MALEHGREDPSYYMPYQYGNEANPLAHYNGTALEILEELDEVSAFVAGLGTGGTLMGNGRRLKEELGDAVKIVAAEPMQGEPVQGLRSLDDGFIPPIIDLSLLDRKIFVTNRDAIVWTRKLLDEEGIFAGVSSGAIARVAVRIAGELDEGNVVFIVADDGWKYLLERPLHAARSTRSRTSRARSGGEPRVLPRRCRLHVVVSPAGEPLSRRRVLLAAGAAATAVAGALSGCGSASTATPTTPEVNGADADVLDALLAVENRAAAAYAHAAGLLNGAHAALARRLRVQEAAHAYALTGRSTASAACRRRPSRTTSSSARTPAAGRSGWRAQDRGRIDRRLPRRDCPKLTDPEARAAVAADRRQRRRSTLALVAQARGLPPLAEAIVRGGNA